MAVLTRIQDLPLRARLVAERITARGLGWTYEQELPLARLQTTTEADPRAGRRVQVRSESRNVPQGRRREYREAMRNGRQFPPPVISADFWVIDGNIRFAAMLDNHVESAPVFILRDNYADTSMHTQATMRLLGADLNIAHGQPLDDEDKHDVIFFCLRDGWTVDMLTRDLNQPRPYVTNISHEVQAIKRALAAGIPEEVFTMRVRSSARKRALGRADINPDLWLLLAELVMDTDMPERDINDMVPKIKEVPTDEARRLIKAEREARAGDIAAVKAGGRGHNSSAGNVMRGAGLVHAQARHPEGATERNPVSAPRYLTVLRQLQEDVALLVAAQERAMADLGIYGDEGY